ncbi:hypothetical protein [Mycoplasmopsis pullorum]|uniref:hypothetical protein n=1 Tax=Mycoplasmopsis pullorum TaxID=48003 RepID=UPI00111872AE|nr:hypothetical protein [Mycoplasmopsis pullorum]TNK83283.1 hypothetical protein C4M93_02675 [Mycoplasmopsis pullorum]TNK88077.1 hypothetical protein C4M89_03700 [Mycoplasmopsis pullorum]TNK91786.1 hypothetical protein C4M96_03460 [Mycoplasmopsis pullorum]
MLFTPAHDIFDVRDLNSFSKLIYYGKKQDRYTLNLLPIPILRSEILNSLTINFTYPQIDDENPNPEAENDSLIGIDDVFNFSQIPVLANNVSDLLNQILAFFKDSNNSLNYQLFYDFSVNPLNDTLYWYDQNIQVFRYFDDFKGHFSIEQTQEQIVREIENLIIQNQSNLDEKQREHLNALISQVKEIQYYSEYDELQKTNLIESINQAIYFILMQNISYLKVDKEALLKLLQNQKKLQITINWNSQAKDVEIINLFTDQINVENLDDSIERIFKNTNEVKVINSINKVQKIKEQINEQNHAKIQKMIKQKNTTAVAISISAIGMLFLSIIGFFAYRRSKSQIKIKKTSTKKEQKDEAIKPKTTKKASKTKKKEEPLANDELPEIEFKG